MITGLLMLLVFKLVQGFYADRVYEKQYSKWRIDPASTESGRSTRNTVCWAPCWWLRLAPLIVYKFTVNASLPLLDAFPEQQVSAMILGEGEGTIFSNLASWMEAQIDAAAAAGGDVFDGIVAGVRSVLDALTVALIGSPWPVVMLVICVTAWRAAGPACGDLHCFVTGLYRAAGLLGCGNGDRGTGRCSGVAVRCFRHSAGYLVRQVANGLYRAAEPVLDLMQTLPAFVYLIPIIAFFGTGNPPGILATIIFGMPPVIRLTALGMRGVPDSIKEAAVAFGASKWQLLKDVEIPLALAFDHDRGKPDNPDVSVYGGDYLTDRRRRSGQGNP